MGLEEKIIEIEYNTIEVELEKLATQIIDVLKEHKEKGLIGEEEYKKHIRRKKEFLTYLNNKRLQTTINIE